MKKFQRRLRDAKREILMGVVTHKVHGQEFSAVEILVTGAFLWGALGATFYRMLDLQDLWLAASLCEPRHIDRHQQDGYWDFEYAQAHRPGKGSLANHSTRKTVFYISLGYLDQWECVTHAHRIAQRFGLSEDDVETLEHPFYSNTDR